MATWLYDAPLFSKEILGVTFEDWQMDAWFKFLEKDRNALLGSKGVGKSMFEACIGCWWLSTRKLAQVICTSKDSDNLQDGLWKEIGGLYQKSAFLQSQFKMNTERVFHRKHSADWFMAARGWRKHADQVEQAQALAGKHGPAMLWIGDEAGSYGEAIMVSGEAILANAVPGSGLEAKILLGGNTTDPKGPLGKVSRDPETYAVTQVNGDPDNPKRAKRVSKEWAQGLIKRYGRDNPWVKVAVFAEFPDVGFKNILGPEDIERAKRRVYAEPDYQHSQKRIGVDVARFGDDATVISVRQGVMAGPFLELRKQDTQQIADRVALAVQRTGAELVFVDQTGVGGGVVDALRRLRVKTVGIDASSKPTDERYWNKRAEMWFRMSEWVRDLGYLPPGLDSLEKDLMAPEYDFKNSKFLLQDKDLIKQLLGRSPDWGDSFALTFAAVDQPATGINAGFWTPTKTTGDFDPLRSLNPNVGKGNYDPLDSSKL